MKRLSVLISIAICLAGLGLAAAPAQAGGEARYFRVRSQEDFLAGTLSGIAVDPLGTLSLADRVDRLADLGEPFLFSIADHPRGWVIGTGNSGKVLLVSRDGTVETLFTAAEPEVFAVWADPDGTVFAGTSPEGKVYRISPQGSDVFFDPQETYVWGLARDATGGLLVATGTEGRLYRVSKAGTAEVVFDGEDTHLRALEVLNDGAVLIGTAGEGMILRIDAKGDVRTLYDGSEPEVVALAAGPDGSCYAALLASEASLVDLAASSPAASASNGGKEGNGGNGDAGGDANGEATATVTTSSDSVPAFVGSRPAGFNGARSVVLHISPTGLVERLWEFQSETVYSLRWHRDRLWAGTGLEGKLYSFQDGRMVLEKDVDEKQIVAVAGGRPGPVFATTNSAALFSVTAESEPSGIYTSAALDATQVARFGSLRWLGDQPKGSTVEFSARSGMSAQPDRTWSSWTKAESGRELSLAGVPSGRYLQWRVEMGAVNEGEPVVSDVTVSYVQENLAPRIEEFAAMDPGEVIVPATFNPGNQIFEPTSPTKGGMFTTLEASGQKQEGRRKTLWKKGFQTLTWEAEDPNDDTLTYSLLFRRDGSTGGWLPMTEDLDESYYSFDTAALPDGAFRFLLRAADRNGHSAVSGLVAEQVSESLVVDNSPPALLSATAGDDGIVVEIADTLSPLRSVRASADAGDWWPVAAADGLLDGRRERLVVAMPDSASLLLLQVMDAAFNVVTFDLSRELP